MYAPWACMCLAEFADMCKGVITHAPHVRGFYPPPPRETVVSKAGGASLHCVRKNVQRRSVQKDCNALTINEVDRPLETPPVIPQIPADAC